MIWSTRSSSPVSQPPSSRRPAGSTTPVRTLHANANPDTYPESTQDAEKSRLTTGPGPPPPGRIPRRTPTPRSRQREADAKTATNADHIAVQVLATTLSTPIHVDAGGPEPGSTRRSGRSRPRAGRTRSRSTPPSRPAGATPTRTSRPLRSSSARPTRPAPVPSAGGVDSHSGGGIAESKVLHDRCPDRASAHRGGNW